MLVGVVLLETSVLHSCLHRLLQHAYWLSLKGVSTGDGTEPTAGGRAGQSGRLKRSSKEGEPSSIDKEFPSETLSCSLFRAVGWADVAAVFVPLRQVDLPGRTAMARPVRVAWLLRADFRRAINC